MYHNEVSLVSSFRKIRNNFVIEFCPRVTFEKWNPQSSCVALENLKHIVNSLLWYFLESESSCEGSDPLCV